MHKKYLIGFVLVILLFLGYQCKQHPDLVIKNHDNDPFSATIVPSQAFQIDAKKDTIIQGSEGTLLIFQKGSFIDANENIVTSTIEINLAEALTLKDMLLSNLTTTSGDQLLETDGMIYLNATTQQGEQLFVNPEKPLYIEIPTSERKPGMSVYQGTRDQNGNMDWINPVPIKNYLVPIDLFTLDFLPDGFAEAVEKEMPFHYYEFANEQLIDSLYYSLYFREGKEISEEPFAKLDINESYYSKEPEYEIDSLSVTDNFKEAHYGVDPATIKAIRNIKFQNTLLATRQFEERLKVMFKICRTDIIDIYINNLEKNLWELDSIATSLLDDNAYQEDFKKFATQKWGNIKEPNKNLNLLKRFYEKRMQAIKEELVNQRNVVVKANNDKSNEAKVLVEKYKKLLNKREAYRMTGYGFEMTSTGWINIDRGTQSKDWSYSPLEFIVTNNDSFNRIYGYIIFTSMKSLYRLNGKDSKTFYVGNENQREMIMPKKERAIGVMIAYQNEQPFLDVQEFQTNSQSELKFQLRKSTKEKINKVLSAFETNKLENSILEDLRYMDKIHLEKIRQDKLQHLTFVMSQLKKASSPADSSYMKFNNIYKIDILFDTCLNKVRNSNPKF